MKREIYLKNIADSLAILSRQVSYRNTINLFDINIIAEDFYSGLLNIICDYELRNINSVERNATGIDLADGNNRVCVQVTSDKSSDKIKHTIEEFIKNERYKDYDRLIILILVDKAKYTTTFSTNNIFSFDKDRDVWDNNDLLEKIRSFDIEKLRKVNDYLQKELNDTYATALASEANEVETIIDLVEFISANRKYRKPIDTVIDPEYKIKKRFKDFTLSLEQQYTSLLGVYGSAVQNVYETLGIDEAQDIVIACYLQDISEKFLDKAGDDPIGALQGLVDYFEEKISVSGKKYDRMAIRFYLVNEIIKCNVFPNERSKYNGCKS